MYLMCIIINIIHVKIWNNILHFHQFLGNSKAVMLLAVVEPESRVEINYRSWTVHNYTQRQESINQPICPANKLWHDWKSKINSNRCFKFHITGHLLSNIAVLKWANSYFHCSFCFKDASIFWFVCFRHATKREKTLNSVGWDNVVEY